MAVLKCKMCGGDLNIADGASIAVCEFCGAKQTVPNINDEKKANLFNRANRLRLGSEFDRAAGIYENIIAEFPEESEAYWGLVLCEYGIEYVDDPRTAEKIPTCHRTSFESIFDNSNYKSAIKNSDIATHLIYESEAKTIDSLQKDILNIVGKEEPFDVFICYKETDEIGGRTLDSVLAQDIYDHLTDKGFKVFFSRITLEDKLGQQYEPYIFAALNSAKVMLAIGTRPEFFEAVWVKNEWGRFLSLMHTDRSKVLVPCYRDMDPYDMPSEFKNLQGQDMGKLGFIQDLTRGISKIIYGSDGKSVSAPSPISAAKSENVCPICSAILAPDAKFCTKCGAAVSSPGERATPNKKFCPICSTELIPGNKFCIKCGAQVAQFPTIEDERRNSKDLQDGIVAMLGKDGGEYSLNRIYRSPLCAKMNVTEKQLRDNLLTLLEKDLIEQNFHTGTYSIKNAVALRDKLKKEQSYQNAKKLYEASLRNKNYTTCEIAANMFEALGDYEDSAEWFLKTREDAKQFKLRAEAEKARQERIKQMAFHSREQKAVAAGRAHEKGLKDDIEDLEAKLEKDKSIAAESIFALTGSDYKTQRAARKEIPQLKREITRLKDQLK